MASIQDDNEYLSNLRRQVNAQTQLIVALVATSPSERLGPMIKAFREVVEGGLYETAEQKAFRAGMLTVIGNAEAAATAATQTARVPVLKPGDGASVIKGFPL